MKGFRTLLKVCLAALVLAVAVMPSSLLACAACTGRSDGSLAQGMNWGIVTLLGFILSVLGCLTLFFVHVARRTPPDDSEVPPAAPE